MKFGSHVSIREGYLGAAKHAEKLNASAFQYFPKNPRSLSVKAYDQVDADHCKKYCQEQQLASVSHSPYPTNLTPLSDDKRDMVTQSLLNDLEISDSCGSIGVVVHFGKEISKTNPLASYQLMIETLNCILSKWDGGCKVLLENSAGKPGSIGTTFKELLQVRNLCDFPHKIGFCLDTCHAFASGLWDGDNWHDLVTEGEELGYFDHLKVIHLNNSKYPTRSGKDRHANIFDHGHIEENQFEELIKHPLFKDVPFILETPKELGVTHEEEIKQLNKKWGK